MNYLKLENDTPVTIAFKHLKPKPVKGFSGPELKWTLTTGRALYTPVAVRTEIDKLGIQASGTWHVTHLPDLSSGQAAAGILDDAPELAEPEASIQTKTGTIQRSKPQPVQALRKPPQTALAVALKTAISAASIAEKHAESLGYSCRFSSSDIRAMGISVLISMSQGGRVA